MPHSLAASCESDEVWTIRARVVRQGQQDVVEVEVDTEGRWRYTASTSAPWNDISADPAMVAPLAPTSAPGFEDAEVCSGLQMPLRQLAMSHRSSMCIAMPLQPLAMSQFRSSMCIAIACRTIAGSLSDHLFFVRMV